MIYRIDDKGLYVDCYIRKNNTYYDGDGWLEIDFNYVEVKPPNAKVIKWVDGEWKVVEEYPKEPDTPIATQVDDLQAQKANKTQEVNKSITYQNGWAATVASSYYKDEFGIVHLMGRAYGGTVTIGTTITTLPVGYRPSTLVSAEATVWGDVSDITAIVLTVGTDGAVKFLTTAKYNVVFNLSFRV